MNRDIVCNLVDVGRMAGVTAATASMALRNDPRISEPTQKRVRQAARKLGYMPDPILSALVARRHRNGKKRSIANLAALIDDRWLTTIRQKWLENFLQGMHSACHHLGYHLDELWLQRDLGSLADPDRLLHARGIRGIVLMPTLDDQFRLSIDLDSYSLVIMGNSRFGAMAHRVGSDAFAGMQLVCDKLVALGYRRIGMAHPRETERRLRYEWLGSLSKEHLLPGNLLEIIPPYMPDVKMEERHFKKWLRTYKPQCIVTNWPELLPWLSEYRIPRDLGIVFLSCGTVDHPNPSGISQHLEVIGRSAIEQLHNSLMRGETGFPSVPKEILIRPHWTIGGTVRRLRARD